MISSAVIAASRAVSFTDVTVAIDSHASSQIYPRLSRAVNAVNAKKEIRCVFLRFTMSTGWHWLLPDEITHGTHITTVLYSYSSILVRNSGTSVRNSGTSLVHACLPIHLVPSLVRAGVVAVKSCGRQTRGSIHSIGSFDYKVKTCGGRFD